MADIYIGQDPDSTLVENARLRSLLDICCDAPLKLEIAKQTIFRLRSLADELADVLRACSEACYSGSLQKQVRAALAKYDAQKGATYE